MMGFQGTAGLVLAGLQPYKVKQVGSNKFRSNSPLRPNSDSQAFELIIRDDEHGAYKIM